MLLLDILLRQGSAQKIDETEAMCTTAIRWSAQEVGSDHPETTRLMMAMGELRAKRGHFRDAEILFASVRRARVRTLGADHESTLASLARMAHLMVQQRRLEEAVPLLDAAIEAYGRAHGVAHPGGLVCRETLAVLRRDQGAYDRAKLLSLGVIEMRSEVLGSMHRDTLLSVRTLASVLFLQGNLKAAETAARRSLEGLAAQAANVQGRQDDVDHALAQIGEVLRAQGREEEAVALKMKHAPQITVVRASLQGATNADNDKSSAVGKQIL